MAGIAPGGARIVMMPLKVTVVTVSIIMVACAAVIPAGPTVVTINRDDWGVPHISASEEQHAFYGLGYAQAEDRLERLLGALYWSRGRLAELRGESDLAGDIERRRWRHVDEGRRGLARLEPQVASNYRQFVAGIKRYMTDHPNEVPAWAPDFDAADFIVLSRAVFWTAYASVLGPAECEKGRVDLYSSVREAADSVHRGASNAWVMGPARTANRALMLVADPHVEVQSTAYYEYRLHAGDVDAAGFALGPLLWQSHNQDVAWGMTTGNTDMWDCYAVEVDPENPSRYEFDGEMQDMLQIEETFDVAGRPPHVEVFEYTQHNGVLSPVVARDGNMAYVVSTSQMHDSGVLDNEIREMIVARDVWELQKAMGTLGMFPQNIVAGDSSGNMLYWRAGKTPVRPEGFDWTAAVPGNSSATMWQGYYPREKMIQVVNPKEGYLQNNNVAPDALFKGDNLKASEYAGELFNDTPGRITSRGVRTIDVLSTATDFTIEDAMGLIFDEKWVTSDSWLHALRFAVARHPRWMKQQTEETMAVLDRLLNFDGIAAADSVAAFNFYIWRQGMKDVLLQPQFESLRNLPWEEAHYSPAFLSALLEEVEHAAQIMTQTYGKTSVRMGDVFRVGRGNTTWPVGGETIDAPEVPSCVANLSPLCERTMRAFASGAADDNGQRRIHRGSSATRLVEFGNPVRSWSLYVHGQNEDPSSLHYNDQSRLVSERALKPEYFNADELVKHTVTTVELVIVD